MFPNGFGKALGRGNQALAELGFVVVAIDGLGTAGRSRLFIMYLIKIWDKTCWIM
ncbi:S9 family peptidase [Niabella sp. W65]|nr:S9 family peptidase [Niabella sp. W65]MCH7368992.1 S9 family peptidase [Niabella sp. W65]ULT44563.1 S9 family peptidase [Niabella sp. I65]